jgi:hypothetical protein
MLHLIKKLLKVKFYDNNLFLGLMKNMKKLKDIRNRMLVSLRGGGGELGNLKP